MVSVGNQDNKENGIMATVGFKKIIYVN